MKEKKILVIGNFGYKTNQLDGQTIKTRNILNLLKSKSNFDVNFFDTQNFAYNKLSTFTFIVKVLFAKNIIILPAHSAIKVLLPFVYLVSLFTKSNIIYIQIGGWLSSFLETKRYLRHVLSNIKVQFIETKILLDELKEKYEFTNVDYFPNFRLVSFIQDSKIVNTDKFRIVFMARINKMKGLDYIEYLAKYILTNKLDKNVILDLYGPIAEKDKEYFNKLLSNNPICNYNGTLEPTDIYSTLSKYDVMILPTHYYTEGFPGSILDAYISGIPVIATHWKHAEEFIDDNKTGFIIPFKNGEEELCAKVKFLIDNRNLLFELKKNAHIKSSQYTPDTAFERLNIYLK